MKIVNIQFNFFTKKLENLQGNVDKFSEAAKDYFKLPLKITNVDDTKPVELPRIIGEPKYGFSFVCTMNNLKIVYDNIPAEIDDSVVLDTLASIVSKMGSFLENYIDSAFNYTGLTIRTRCTKEDIGDSPLLFMLKKFPSYDTKNAIDNISFRSAYIEPPYYINIGMKAGHMFDVAAKDRYSKPTKVSNYRETFDVEFDVNNKYAFFNDDKYFPEIEHAERLVDSTIRFYNEELLEFIKTGKVNHFFLGK